MNEQERELRKLQLRYSISLYLLLALIVVMVIVLKLFGGIGLIFGALAILDGFYLVRAQRNFTGCYKDRIVRAALSDCAELSSVHYDPDDGIPYATVADTGILRLYDTYDVNDLITAVYHGVSFCRSDVKIEEVTSTGNDTSSFTQFCGSWFAFTPAKPYPGTVQVISPKFHAAERRRDLSEVGISILGEFAEHFETYADTPEHAAAILTPRVQQALVDLCAKAKAPVMFLFLGDTVHIVIRTGVDAFEGKQIGAIRIEEEKQAILRELLLPAKLIDAMNG